MVGVLVKAIDQVLDGCGPELDEASELRDSQGVTSCGHSLPLPCSSEQEQEQEQYPVAF